MWFIDILIIMYQVRVCDFTPEFRGKMQQYIQHVDMHGGKISNSEYAGTPSLSEQYYQWLTLQKITPYNHKMKYKFNTITKRR